MRSLKIMVYSVSFVGQYFWLMISAAILNGEAASVGAVDEGVTATAAATANANDRSVHETLRLIYIQPRIAIFFELWICRQVKRYRAGLEGIVDQLAYWFPFFLNLSRARFVRPGPERHG